MPLKNLDSRSPIRAFEDKFHENDISEFIRCPFTGPRRADA
jgi:hypothetical protein